MSSKYPVLDNRPIDQWKVTELKEELKRRKLVTKGLKDDLIRRLDDALRFEMESAAAEVAEQNEKDSSNVEDGKGSNFNPEPQIEDRDVKTKLVVEDTRDNGGSITQKVDEMVEDTRDNGESVTQKVDEMVEDTRDNGESVTQKVDEMAEDTTNNGENLTPMVGETATAVDINDTLANLNQGNIQEGKPTVGIESAGVVEEPVVVAVSVDINTSVTETVVTEIEPSVESQDNEKQVKNEDPKHPHEDDVLNVSDSNNQVSEVSPVLGFQVKCESISTDSVSINEKNELKDSLNADNFHLELEVVKPEKVEPSSSDIPPNGGDIPPLDEQEPREKQSSIAELDDTNATNVDLSKKIDSADGGSSEKLNLDRSPGDDFMEEDVMDSKHIESNHSSDEVVDKSEVPIVKEESPVDVTDAAISSHKKDVSGEIKNSVAVPAEKRKLEEKVVENNEPPKRQRRWNSETLKVPEPSASVLTPTTTPKETFQSTIPRRNFTRSDSTVSGADTPKERVVPPSSKPPTNSLRIDRFLRPFTLKAVQELLAKTGTVSSFWMDHIKTHCYVTYSSAEEAKETRNALYNLQWPANGGRLLVAEFVDPQEVKMRAEATSQSPATPVSTTPTTPAAPLPFQAQPSPRQHAPKEQLPPPPPLPLLPPPPLTNPPAARERLTLPPPPPLPTKTELPILTLDDLFRKTRATPRIYYLPLSEEQVAVKLAAQRTSKK